MNKDTAFRDMLLDKFSEQLGDMGIVIIPNIAELVFMLRQKFNDLKYFKGDGHIIVYLSNVIDLEYYLELVNKIAPDRKMKESDLLFLLTEFVKISRKNNTTIEDEIREFYR